MAKELKTILPVENETHLLSKEEYQNIVNRLKRSDILLTGIIIVMFLGFATLFLSLAGILRDQWLHKETAYQEFNQTLQESRNLNQELKQFLIAPSPILVNPKQ